MVKKEKKPLSDRQLLREVYGEVVDDYLKDSLNELAETVMTAIERHMDDFEAGKKPKEEIRLELYKCDLMMGILSSRIKRLDTKAKKRP